jgi:inorganic triphosphatase YgiF
LLDRATLLHHTITKITTQQQESTKTNMEIEAKFRIADTSVFTHLVTLQTLGAYTLRGEDQPVHQRNTYYDTSEQLLAHARYGLRTREAKGKTLVTLKGPNLSQRGIQERAEWTMETDNPDPNTWDNDEARNQALAIIGETPLIPLLTMETQRRHIYAMQHASDEAIAELCLDEVTIFAGGQTRSFCELEIELLHNASHCDLDALITALQAHHTLIPEPRTKLEQGLALLEETTTK